MKTEMAKIMNSLSKRTIQCKCVQSSVFSIVRKQRLNPLEDTHSLHTHRKGSWFLELQKGISFDARTECWLES